MIQRTGLFPNSLGSTASVLCDIAGVRRRNTVIAGFLAVVFAALAYAARNPEPRFQHHTLSYWTSLYFEESSPPVLAPAAQRERADDAIRHLGTNSIPYLLKWAQYHPFQRPERMDGIYRRLPRSVRTNDLFVRLYHNDPKYIRAIAALLALDALGPDAAPAAPRLVSMLETNEWLAQRTANVLVSIGPPAVRALIAASTNTFNPNRFEVIRSIAALGTNGGFAVPVLTSLLEDPDEGIRLDAKASLYTITNGGRGW